MNRLLTEISDMQIKFGEKMKSAVQKRFIVALGLSALLAGCGGGGK